VAHCLNSITTGPDKNALWCEVSQVSSQMVLVAYNTCVGAYCERTSSEAWRGNSATSGCSVIRDPDGDDDTTVHRNCGGSCGSCCFGV
jgi:hypothetical protein